MPCRKLLYVTTRIDHSNCSLGAVYELCRELYLQGGLESTLLDESCIRCCRSTLQH